MIKYISAFFLLVGLAACGGQETLEQTQDELRTRAVSTGATILILESIGFDCDHGGIGDVSCKKCGTDADGTRWCITYDCDRYTGSCYRVDVETHPAFPVPAQQTFRQSFSRVRR